MNGIDPLLNCASEICCRPPEAREATATLLHQIMDSVTFGGEAGDKPDTDGDDSRHRLCLRMAAAMKERGICLLPVHLAKVIADLADHPGRK